jgi:hypothetical protein
LVQLCFRIQPANPNTLKTLKTRTLLQVIMLTTAGAWVLAGFGFAGAS